MMLRLKLHAKHLTQLKLSWGSVLMFFLQPLSLVAETSQADALNFELFSIQNGQSVRLKALPPQVTLVNFWRADCPPCVKELPLLIAMSERLNIRLVTISVQTLSETKSYWHQVPGNSETHIALLAPSNPSGILRRFGNQSGAIPHSVMLNTNNQMCGKRTGEIDESWMQTALLQCQTKL